MAEKTGMERFEKIAHLLACPHCHAPLNRVSDHLSCSACAENYPFHLGRPVFIPKELGTPRIAPEGHVSNQPPGTIFDWMTWQKGWILNVGAGGTKTRLDNVVEMEFSIFGNTDVVADAHHLPFADDAFDAVVTFNTFEHLSNPDQAAAEILRVMKPGAKLYLHTAFLQPVHEPPYHFYNTTEYGLRRWFSAFEIDNLFVSENFNPAYVLSWLSSEILRATEGSLGVEARKKLGASTLDFWQSQWEQPQTRNNACWEIMKQLPQEIQKRFSAGFQMEAHKPG